MKMQKGQQHAIESIFHLNVIANHIAHAMKVFELGEEQNDERKAQLRLVTQSFVLLNGKKFLDEYDYQFRRFEYLDDKFQKRVNDAHEIIQPLYDKIKQEWPDIDKFRNNVLAHNFRNKDNREYQSIFFDGSLSHYKIPNSFAECYYFGKYIYKINELIECLFHKESDDGKRRLRNISSSKKSQKSDDEVKSEYDKVVYQVKLKFEALLLRQMT